MLTNGNHQNSNQLDPAPVTIGTKIKQARLAAGLTRAQLGDKVKVSAKTIENWEGDQSEPPLKRLKALGRILDVSPQEFLDEIEDENGNGDAARDPEALRAQHDEEVRRTAQKLARLLGGTMVFRPPSGDPESAEPEPVEVIRGAVEFDELRRVVENRGTTSSAVPARVKALDDVLSTASPDDLRELAQARDVSLFECAPAKGDAKSDDVQCAMQAQLVLGALGYPDLSSLTYSGGEDLVSRLVRVNGKDAFGTLDTDPMFWTKKGEQEWLDAARPLIARNLVIAFAAGKGMLPKEGAIATAPKAKKPANGDKPKRKSSYWFDE
jgi:transcriptional regulator with XRE-family HTH domain